jgi:Xaa-Pro aminopeptidase
MRLASPELHAARLRRLRAALDVRHLDGLLVTSLQNVAYLTGLFASSAAAIVTRAQLRVITDNRYREALDGRVQDWEALTPVILPQGLSYDEVIIQQLRELAGMRLGFEDTHVSVRRMQGFEAARKAGSLAELVAAPEVVEDLRVVKDEWELQLLREAAGRLSGVAKCILPKALAGTTEWQLASELEAAMRRAGFDKAAFDTIVASGPNAALPHYRAGERRLESGDLVVMDFGGVLDGYAVDMTRTVAVDGGGKRERRVIGAVADAHAAAIRAVRPGAAPEAVDAAARTALQGAGFGEAFTHATGHGLGLDVHERPRIGPARTSVTESPLAIDMVFTIEPGVYFPGWGGVRLEDDVVVTAAGCDILTAGDD